MNKQIFLLILSSFILYSCNVSNNVGSTSSVQKNINNTKNHYMNDIKILDTKEDSLRVSDIEDVLDKLVCGGRNSCSDNIAYLAKNVAFDINKKPVVNNGLDIKFIKLTAVNYDTCPKFDNTPCIQRKVSGAIMIPQNGDHENSDKIKGVVVYFHPTAFDKSNVPSMSYFDKISQQDYLYAAIYASQGYIVVLPDYIGQGIDYTNIHPYVLYPQQNVNSAINLLNSGYLRSIARDISVKRGNGSYDYSGLPVFSVGYSEGAAYSMWFSKCVQDYSQCNYVTSVISTQYGPNPVGNLYKYVGSVGLDGAYDLSGAVKPFLTDEVSKSNGNKFRIQNVEITNLVKPGLSMLALMSYMRYDLGYTTSGQFKSGYNESFYSNLKIKDNKDPMNFMEALQQAHVNDTEFVQALFKDALGKKLTHNSKEYIYLDGHDESGGYVIDNHRNSIYALARGSIIDSEQFNTALKNASITDFGIETKKPLMLFSLEHDSVVSPNSTHNFKDSKLVKKIYLENDKIKVEHAIFGRKETPVDHIHGENYANIYALSFINQCVTDNGKCGLSQ